ncbi:type I polyketide synthase [Nocardia sp. CA2R105]|uniref:type I polyketide synthase n=1 Tax=Nocardia coffeae TaxID=2873381 RepID=UPI001CA70079|nr:type I polyketide synthase [Nocardia coffeae]MBY8854966.1 type I polyketide synthase [Nocardia coffeae]
MSADRWSRRKSETESGSCDPIVIVGMACRLPGGVNTPEDLWRVVEAGEDMIGGLPTDRGWDLDRLYESAPGSPGTFYVEGGGFVDDVAGFDADFFGISPREALAMHPAQRLLLETAWEAIERAGIVPASLRETATGVFVGGFALDYGPPLHYGTTGADGHLLTGGQMSVASGRIAYLLGLTGPALSVDTACSSSLVALHLAAASLRAGECDLALAGGTTVLSSPGLLVEFSRQAALAADGRSRAFGADACGFGAAEGAGMIVLERLSDARRHGHPIRAVIRGSALNQDGTSAGLTAPSESAQQQVIRQALQAAGLCAADVDLIEAHGTGTRLGDVVEARSLLATYGRDRPVGKPAYLGSVKSNIGHTQAAAGVVGVMKVVQALEHRILPRTLHADVPNTRVDWDSGQVSVLTEQREWPGEGPRRAGVLAYGISGTNAHVIVEEPTARTGAEHSREPGPAVPAPWVLSAKSESALRGQARRLLDHVRERPELESADVGWSLAFTRSRFEHRAVVCGRSRDELLDGLRSLADDAVTPAVIRSRATQHARPVFVFPGQGSQWDGMVTTLLATVPRFADSVRACDEALAPHLGWSVREVLRRAPGAPGLDRPDVVQPVLFATMIALAELWRGYGVEPCAVVGHSQGEIAAAHCAGALSLADAARVVALRSKAIADLADNGAMATVAVAAEELEHLLEPWHGRVSIAAVNGRRNCVVSGDAAALTEFLAACESDGTWARRIAVDYASHSPAVEAVRDRLLADLATIEPRPSRIPMYSTVTGDVIDTQLLNAEYWYRNLRRRVRFGDAIDASIRDGFGALIEVSPHPVLTMAMQEITESASGDTAVLSTLQRGEGELAQVHRSVAAAHAHGVDVDLSSLYPAGRRVELPTYAFEHRRFWLAPSHGSSDAKPRRDDDHPLLDSRIQVAGTDSTILTGKVSTDRLGWPADHVVGDTALLPGTAFVEMAWYAASVVERDRVVDLVLEAPLPIPADESVELQVNIEPAGDGEYRLRIFSRPADRDSWTRHATGVLAAGDPEHADDDGVQPWPPEAAQPVDLNDFYDRLNSRGYRYGPAFRNLRTAWRRHDDIFAEVVLADEPDARGYGLHPALLDAALQVSLLDDSGPVTVPFSWDSVRLHSVGATRLRVHLTRAGEATVNLSVTDGAGKPVADLCGLVLRPLPDEVVRSGPDPSDESLFRIAWEPLTFASESTDSGSRRWALVGLESGERGNAVPWQRFDTVAALSEAAAAPDVVVVEYPCAADDLDVPAEVRETVRKAVRDLQTWLSIESLDDAQLVVVTRGGVAVDDDTQIHDLTHAAIWGVIRSAQTEHPGRITLIDLDDAELSPEVLAGAVTSGEPQLAVRNGQGWIPRLAAADTTRNLLTPNSSEAWGLRPGDQGTIDALELAPTPQAQAPLEPGQVRVGIRAAGINFRDVLLASGMIPRAVVGEGFESEGAGVVLEVGSEVTAFTPGDRVMGLFTVTSAFGTHAVSDHRLLVAIPEQLSFEQAGTIPGVFLTAYYALVDLANLQPGESILIHAAAGGVGMAAVQLAQHLGAEVFATASPPKWDVVRESGIDDAHLASSRTLGFETRFLELTGGAGVDVTLNCLAREFIDASLRLHPNGGRFVEMGKTDLRDPAAIAGAYPEVVYRAFDLRDVPVTRLNEIFMEVVGLLDKAVLRPLPVRAWDIRQAKDAFRYVSRAQHIGKNALVVPRPIDPEGTILITGGTGTLGTLMARHLVTAHGARHLLLVSRRGAETPGAAELRDELTAAGAEVTIAACDVSDPQALRSLLETVPDRHPLTAVVHTAGVLDDAAVTSVTSEQIDSVLRPKVDAAWNLHHLTRHLDLSAFVLYSSMAGQLGTAGQAVYASANSFLDALAAHRRSRGLPATSLAWGLWERASTMTAGLDERDRTRLLGNGLRPIPDQLGLELFDRSARFAESVLAASPLDLAAFTSSANTPAVLSGLVHHSTPDPEPPTASSTVRLEDLGPQARKAELLHLIRASAAMVLGHNTAEAIDPERSFRDVGLDSLTAVQLRNQLKAATGIPLAPAAVFDHRDPHALCDHLDSYFITSPETQP